MNKPFSSLVARAFGVFLTLATGALSVGCAASEGVVLIGGERVDSATIDRDPLALLPGGVIAVAQLDAAALFKTPLGGDVGRLVANLLPLGPESNFVASRDVSRVVAGAYAMQGADFCVVLQGGFDVERIDQAANAKTLVPSGVPLVKSRYAEMDLYTAGNIGFVTLTSHTIVSGNETGMRRVLDRLRSAKLERSVPSWMIDLMGTQGATLSMAADLTSKVPVDKVLSTAPFVQGLHLVRVVGNFEPPGLNFAGTLTYFDEARAQAGEASLQSMQQAAQFMSLFTALGFGVAVPPVNLKTSGSDVAFTAAVDERFARVLIGLAVSATSFRIASGPPQTTFF